MPVNTLKKWPKQVKTKGNVTPFKGAKKPPKYSVRVLRALKIAAVRNKDERLKKIGELAQFDGCHKTIVKYLKKEDIVSVVAARVLLFMSRND